MKKTDFDRAVAQILRALPKPQETPSLPLFLLLSGLPGTGKSFLARKIAEQIPCITIESDFVRKTLTDGNPVYTPDESLFIHRVSHKAIERLLLDGYRVIHDATNLAEWHRDQMYNLAARTRSKLVIVQTTAPEAVIRKRLAQRFAERDESDLSDADWQIHEKLKPELEKVRRPHIVVDTNGDIDEALRKILRAAR